MATVSLLRFDKQSAEVQDYDVDFTDYLSKHSDVGASASVEVDAGLTMLGHSLNYGIVKVWLGGGVDGVTYKVTVTLSTTSVPARVKQAEFTVRVKNI